MILLIKYTVQTVRVFVHPVLLSLSRGKRLYAALAKFQLPQGTYLNLVVAPGSLAPCSPVKQIA